MIYFLSALSFILLTIKFGLPAFLTAIFYELSKFSLFGNLFLSETLVIPELLFILGVIFSLVRDKNRKIGRIDLLFLSFSLLFIAFSLLPLAPFVIFSFGLIIYFLKKKQRILFLLMTLFSGIFLIILFSKTIGFDDYIRDTIIINATEFIPREVKSPLPIVGARIFFSPFLSLSLKNVDFFLLLKIISIIYLLSLVILFIRKSYKIPIISLIFLATLNFRAIGFDLFYNGFHLLPYYGGLLLLTFLQVKLISTIFQKKGSYIFLTGIIVILFLYYIPFGVKEFSRENDQYNNWYINYSQLFDYGETIRLLSDPADQMLTVPGASLIYWQSRLFTSSPFFFTYNFMYQSPSISNELKLNFQDNKPKFFYIEDELNKAPIFGEFENLYQRVNLRKKPSRLYILKSKLPEVTMDKWKSVDRYGFSVE